MLTKLLQVRLFWLSLALCLVVFVVQAQEFNERRIRSGLKLFRTVLAADRDLNRKKTVDGKLLVLLVYSDDKSKAKVIGDELANLGIGRRKGMIRNLLIKIKAVSNDQLSNYADKRVAGVYLTQTLFGDELQQLVQYGINKHAVVYSPFEGDVHKGILGGLEIDTAIRPLINLDTMKASKLRIKPFFLKVVKKYES